MLHAVEAVVARKRVEMQWQLSLSLLAQPVLTEEAATEKAQMVEDLLAALSGEDISAPDEDPATEEGALALLRMAGREPIRILNARPGDVSDDP